MLDRRAGGVLLHPTSLPGPYGVGDFGPEARGFVDWLASAGCTLWQILPIGPTGIGNSPYQCRSAFAGNPLLISPDLLVRDGLLRKSDLEDRPAFRETGRGVRRVDFERASAWKSALLRRAFERFKADASENLRQAFAAFRAEQAGWLDEFALFMALKETTNDRAWVDWPEPLRAHDREGIAAARRDLGEAITRRSFFQLLFFRQWWELRDYAHSAGIQIIGDLPIFAAGDSADVWTNPQLFHLDGLGRPTVVSGVPPDYFSETGQLWGNPLYRWEEHERTQYDWWCRRLLATLALFDVVRLDHFRGFVACWEVPAGNPTAQIGRWVPAPGRALFEALFERLPAHLVERELPLIAEDLGVITPDVTNLRDALNVPGMRILQFGFSEPQPLFLPHNYIKHCVAYTGTHDNDTARGWLDSASEDEARYALEYLQATRRGIAWEMMRAIWASVATYVIVPMQDLLGLGTRARMNYPGRPSGNWSWRLGENDLGAGLAERLGRLSELYGRV
jgi:4-alpha-glucanotransferase